MRLLHSALLRRVAAEFLGSALLAAVVVGSGIAAERLSPSDAGLQLLENALATALALPVLILLFIQISGAHFNPVVSLVDSAIGLRSWRDTAVYLPTQIVGCIAGTVLANLMFGAAAVTWSTKERLTGGTFLAEVVATAGLILVIFALARTGRASAIPAAVGGYIGAAYFFTASTSFANPAITVGRMFSESFAGIAPSSAPGFIIAQLIGGGIGYLLVRYFYPLSRSADSTVLAPAEGNVPAASSADVGVAQRV